MFKSLKFSKPKTPGFGVSKSFYITVLAAKAPLPTIFEVVNPKAEEGGVEGFGVPLGQGSCEADLRRPMQHGAYAIASKDRKTVIRCLVVSKEQAGFNPDAFTNSSMAMTASEELLARIRATWTLVQFCFESHDPMVAPSMRLLLEVAKRIAELTDGVIADPIAKRYMLPEDLDGSSFEDPLRPDLHVTIHAEPDGPSYRIFTSGLQKFAMNEVEVRDVPDHMHAQAEAFLLSVAKTAFSGKIPAVGDLVGQKQAAFEVCESAGALEGGGVELIPSRGKSTEECLRAWFDER